MRRLIAILLIWLCCSALGPGQQKPPLGAQLNRSHPLAQGLVRAFPANETTGNILNDATKNSIGHGQALSYSPKLTFNGSASYVLPSNDCVLSNNLTMIYRVFIPDTETLQTIFGRGKWGDWYSYYSGIISGMLYIIMSSSGGFTGDFFWTIPASNVWYDVAIVKSGNFGGLYIGGALKSSNVGLSTLSVGSPRLCLGAGYASTPGEYFNGKIEYAYLYNRGLLSSEISQLHAAPYAMFQRPALSKAYLNFGTGGAPPAAAPTPRRGQVIGRAGKHDIIAWAKEEN